MANLQAAKKIGLYALGTLLALALLGTAGIWLASEPLPEAQEGPAAEAMARRMQEAIGHAQWEQTEAIAWNFAGMHQHLWDKNRNYARVSWGDNEVYLDLDQTTGQAYVDGQASQAAENEQLVQTALEYFYNDSFWLNPVSKLFDPGTRRGVVDLEDGQQGLLVTYERGGATPGDSYLWLLDENGLPKRWKMWVQIIPIGGVQTSWEGWDELSTGVKIATRHKGPLGLTLELSNLRADTSITQMYLGQDPFVKLTQPE